MINLFVKLRVQIFAEVVDHICILFRLVAKKMEERERIETLFTIYTAKKKALINVLIGRVIRIHELTMVIVFSCFGPQN